MDRFCARTQTFFAQTGSNNNPFHHQTIPQEMAAAMHQNGSASTCLEHPIELQDVSEYLSKPPDAKVAAGSLHSTHGSSAAAGGGGLRLSDTKGVQSSDPVENLPSPTTQAAQKLERWNHPRSNFFRTAAAFWSFVVMGSNDAAYGALIPYVCFDHPLFLFLFFSPT